MSQSPEAAARRARYEDGWEAINRLIREDGSWSGRERNCLHLGCDDGTFIDASAASGMDFIEDGRAFAVLDYDRDGRPDLLLRSRNGPRLRVLRNRFPSANRSLWLQLRGVRANRDAVGARIEIETDRGPRVKEVKAGSGFLSQHTRWVSIGLGAEGSVLGARIRWPGGPVQELGPLEPDRRYRVVEGERPAAEPFQRPLAAAPSPEAASPPEPPQSSPLSRIWLLDPLPAPDFRLSDLSGRARSLSNFRGQALVLVFLTAECGACLEESAELSSGIGGLRAAGGAALGLVLGPPDHEEAARERFAGARFPVLLADPGTAAAWNALHRTLTNRYRNLEVPTSFLLDREGRIEKVYRGRVSAADLAADLRRLPVPEEARRELCLPFPGTLLGPPFRRDLFLLGATLTEWGAGEAASRALLGSLARERNDPEALYNLGLALAASGDAEGAAGAYRKALALRPDLVEALNNLGVLEARAGRTGAARSLFEAALAKEPGHGESSLNLARSYLGEGDLARAASLQREALARDPESPVLWSGLGYTLFLQNELDEGIEAYRKALKLAPDSPDAAAGLSNLLLKRGGRLDLPEARRIVEAGVERHPRDAGLLNALGLALLVHEDFPGAEQAYRRAIDADPQVDGPYLNLARLCLKRNDRAGASAALRRLLQAQPSHAAAREMLAGISR